MKMVMVGCSHHDSALGFRERIAFSPTQIERALEEFRQRYPESEAVLLSTCNRVELYAAGGQGTEFGQTELAAFIAQSHGLPSEELINGLVYRSGTTVVEHLFTVAASLDSLVVGETQILTQVKEAYELACKVGVTGPLTHAVFQAANHVAKRVSRETEIHHRRVSVPSVAIGEVAMELFERLDDKKVLVIGAGEMAEDALRYLVEHGARQLHLVNRTEAHGVRLGREYSATTHPWESLSAQIIDADLVVSATSAEEPIVTMEAFRKIHATRGSRLLLILDLAVPRDFEPSIGECHDVYLYGVDDLKAACDRNRKLREREWPKARRIIEEESKKLSAGLQFRASGPIVRRLREQADAVKAEEIKRLSAKLEKYAIPAEAHSEIRYTVDRVVNKLLHPPLESLRDQAESDDSMNLLEALRKLFKL
jgi:glutamyl-tRNA reductase